MQTDGQGRRVGPQASGNPPADGVRAARVEGRLTGRSLPAASGAIIAIACAVMVAFAAGYELGRPAPSPSPSISPSPRSTLAPAIQPAIVDTTLAAAVAQVAADGWAVCGSGTGAFLRCARLAHQPSGPAQPGSDMFRFCQQGYCLSDVDRRALPWTAVDRGHVVVVARSPASAAPGGPAASARNVDTAVAADAIVFDWDQPGRPPPATSLSPVASDNGAFYFDLGDEEAGLRLVVVSELVPADVDAGGSYAEWTTYVAGLAIGVPVP